MDRQRRRLLRLVGASGLGGLAGCTSSESNPETDLPAETGDRTTETDPETNTHTTTSAPPRPEDFESCPKLIIRIPALPDPAYEEVQTALSEGQYETESELYLPHLFNTSSSYLGETGGDPTAEYGNLKYDEVTQYYRAVVTENENTTRLELEPAIPSWGSQGMDVNNEADESMTVELRVERLRDSEVVVDETLSAPADGYAQTARFDQLFGTYRADIKTDQYTAQNEWRISEVRPPADRLELYSDEAYVIPGPRLALPSCAGAWGYQQ